MMELLAAGAVDIGLSLTQAHLASFEAYYRELTIWNQRFNLTAITAYEDVQIKHMLDSLMCLLAFPVRSSQTTIPNAVPLLQQDYRLQCADVGTGAGFPGIPLKIIYPGINLTLIEASHKKTLFLQHIVNVLQLQQVKIVNQRVEEVGQNTMWRGQYDLVVARAVASLNVLAEYCLPLLRIGGRWIAQKGDSIEEELENAQRAIRTCGGQIAAIKSYHLPGMAETRHLIAIDKVHETPAMYPRRPGIPAKKPL